MSKPKFYVAVKNQASTNTLELHFLDDIYNGFDWNTWEEKNMVKDVIDQVKAANPTKIKAVFNSLGGSVMIGLAIYNYLKSSGIEIETENIGFAASIASIMMMSGSKRKMAKNAFMIIHAAWSYSSGNASEMRKEADVLDSISNQLADIYASTSGKHDAKHFTDMWADGDVWLSADQCLEMGLITEITGEVAVKNSIDFSQFGFRNIPQNLIQASAAPANEQQQSFLQHIKYEFMKLKDSLIAAVTGGKEDTTTNNIPNKEEILNLVQSVLTPFAEKIDSAIESLKPQAAAPAPAAEAAPVASAPVEEQKPVAEKTEAQLLREELDALKASIAANITTPKPANDQNSNHILSKVKIQYAEAED